MTNGAYKRKREVVMENVLKEGDEDQQAEHARREKARFSKDEADRAAREAAKKQKLKSGMEKQVDAGGGEEGKAGRPGGGAGKKKKKKKKGVKGPALSFDVEEEQS